jgi:peptidoglycan hydrolase CwlO-like protein
MTQLTGIWKGDNVGLSIDFFAKIAIQLIIQLAILAFFSGTIIQTIKNFNDKLDKIEKKQDKYNKLISRMFVVENKVEDIKEDIQEVKN